MVYSNKFIMCILLNGCPQKELANGVVNLPFGTEYSLRFRNKNNRRAVVQIYIDGENVSGAGYIVNANDYVDIKRHHDIDRSFKFVSLDSPDAVDHGKNGPNDDKVKGTIEARFFLEKEQPAMPTVIYRDIHHHHHDHYRPIFPTPIWYSNSGNETFGVSNDAYSSNCGGNTVSPMGMASTSKLSSLSSNAPRSMLRSKSLNSAPELQLQDGCTVEGNMTGQSFRTVTCETESSYTSVKIFLQGYEEKPETVSKPKKKKSKKDSVQDHRINDLEYENEKLRKEIEEKRLKAENERLKKELQELE